MDLFCARCAARLVKECHAGGAHIPAAVTVIGGVALCGAHAADPLTEMAASMVTLDLGPLLKAVTEEPAGVREVRL